MQAPKLTLSWNSGAIERSWGELTIGRDPACDVVVKSPKTSYRHARVYCDQSGWHIKDLGSTNGTFVDGQRINEPTALSASTRITVGDVHLLAVLPTGAPAPPSRRGGDGSTRGESLRLPERGTVILGRDKDCDFPLPNRNVSWRHAAITVGDGTLTLRDLGSRNGTRVDGHFVRAERLTPPAEITIGPYLIRVANGIITRLDAPSVVLEARNLRYAVDGHAVEVSFTVRAGELVAVIGESGAGKSTLLRRLTAEELPLAGEILLGGEPIQRRRWDVGYVPQHDVVHPSLKIEESLYCAARLRLPRDQSDTELNDHLDAVMGELDLRDHRDKRNDKISGGQRKRVSVATELLGDPRLLVLDEPTTGLDPLWEARMMEVLRRRATGETSVLLVTHSTKWLEGCDRLLVMRRGGEIAFDGPPKAAPTHFGVKTHDAIYERLESDRLTHSRVAVPPTRRSTPPHRPARDDVPSSLAGAVDSCRALMNRDLRLYMSDFKNAVFRLAGVLGVGMLLTSIFNRDVFAPRVGHVTKSAQLLFALLFAVTMFATSSAARELVRERDVFRRERALGVPVAAYTLSKLVVLVGAAVLEAGLLGAITLALAPLHASTATYVEIASIVTLTALVGVVAGLLVSAFARTEAQAATALGFVFIPQLLLAGAIVSVKQMPAVVQWLAGIMPIRWAYAGAGSVIHINDRASDDRGFQEFYGPHFFNAPYSETVAILIAFTFLLGLLLIVRLRRERATDAG